MSPHQQEILHYINHTLELQSLLYDLDLMPEQLKQDSREWGIMMIISAWHMNKFSEPKPE